MLLLIDNFDSFTYNIVAGFEKLGQSVEVARRDTDFVLREKVIIGPGPGRLDVHELPEAVFEKSVLGICMGHQVLGEFFGAKVGPAKTVMHGKCSEIFHDGKGLFKGLSQGFSAMRYHSLAIQEVPDCLEVSAWTEDGEVMGIRHKELPLVGVQFHPDSIGTPLGQQIFDNFLQLVRA